MDTDALIAELANDAGPVRRLPPAWKRTALWFALALPPVLLVVAVHGLDVGAGDLLADRRLLIEQAATLATALSAGLAAFASTVPGGNRKWFWLPLIPFAIWLFTVGKGCVEDWLSLGPNGLSLRFDGGCFLPMVLIGIVPTLSMVVMLRRGAPLSPRLTLVLGTLAIAAVVNFGLRLFHVGDVSIMILVWHFGLVVLLSAAACLAGPRVLPWRNSATHR